MDRTERLRMLTKAHAQAPDVPITLGTIRRRGKTVPRQKITRVRITVQDEYERVVLCAVFGAALLGSCAITFEEFDKISNQGAMNYAYALALEHIEEEIQLAMDVGEFDLDWTAEQQEGR